MSATSPQGKPWVTEIDSTPSRPSSACSRSTKPRRFARGVQDRDHLAVDHAATGRTRPATCAAHRSTSSKARSSMSVCGYSLKAISRSACRSHRGTGGGAGRARRQPPRRARRCAHRASRSPSQSSQPSATIAPCRPSTTMSTGSAARRSASSSSRNVSQAWRVVVPPGCAKATRPSTTVQPLLAGALAGCPQVARRTGHAVRVLPGRKVARLRGTPPARWASARRCWSRWPGWR
jgi:hypothetical protein